VVLIHGWPLDADMWEYQSVVLAQHGLRVVTYDRRGFGRSGQPWTGYDYDTLAADLASIIEKLELQDITLVGFSMGGGEVARYLGRHGSSRIARAAFISAVTPYLLRAENNPDGVDRTAFDQMIEGLQADRPGFLASFGKKFFGVGLLSSPVSTELLQSTLTRAMLASPKATLDCVNAFAETDFRADLKGITIPTLVIHGDADETVPAACSAERMAALVPHAQIRIYGGAPHGLHYTQRDRLNADLLSFIQG
jgi:pimeloyl-ACP methyl ester carboxylesterase